MNFYMTDIVSAQRSKVCLNQVIPARNCIEVFDCGTHQVSVDFCNGKNSYIALYLSLSTLLRAAGYVEARELHVLLWQTQEYVSRQFCL